MKEAPAPAAQSVEKAEVVEVGAQASPDMVDASTEPQEEALVKRKQQRKQKEKGKERAEDSDKEMWDVGRFSPYEDLSEYEKEMEDAASVTPPHDQKTDHQTSGGTTGR